MRNKNIVQYYVKPEIREKIEFIKKNKDLSDNSLTKILDILVNKEYNQIIEKLMVKKCSND